MFAHISAVECSRLSGIKDGQKVSFEPTQDRRFGRRGYEGFSVDLGIDLSRGKDENGNPTTNHTLEGSYQLDDTRQTDRATASV
ncbi:hypothetical protein SAMN05216228_102734 [Rhizobium tibeticum]|uniref:Uncharacterized protein n=1 Tax=Rhizobium tibeticum TaxID=501024 RepID=A0A1H8T3H1_9HYPH|nr:hypothetical protein RTCCBAU85039_5073 [Rhizobium tibeticum]SEO85497.1 hypothetical protein SAMN05216228_102734 [Rhizobium tibeticum]